VCAAGILLLDISARRFYKGPDLNLEYIKSLLQMMVVVVFGTALRFVADAYQRKKSKEDERQKFKQDMLAELVKAYSEVKQLRRVLRARGRQRNGSGECLYLFKHYDKTMERISRQRLLIEGIAEQIKASRKVFTDKAKLGNNIDVMEKYLKMIDTEWQDKLPTLRSSEMLLGQDFPRLSEFMVAAVDKLDERPSHMQFVKPYHDALELLRAEIDRGGESTARGTARSEESLAETC